MNQNFDLHCHPSFKPMLKTKDRPHCWEAVKVDGDKLVGGIFNSQSNLNQLINGNVNLAVVSLHALEMSFAKQWLLKDVLSFLSRKHVEKKTIEEIASGNKPYHTTLTEELANLLAHPQNPNDPKQGMKIIKSISEYDKDDFNTLHIILAVEGGHCFYEDTNKGEEAVVILDRLRKFKNQHRLLYITLTHLGQNTLCNHCYGIKIFSRKDFMPNGTVQDGKLYSGLTELGKQFIRQVVEENDKGKSTFIDIKHMSLQSRLDYYKLRKDEPENFYNIPIVASHMGVTGISYKKITDTIITTVFNEEKQYFKIVYKKVVGHLSESHFNPISINLYDEDIIEILKSNGLIGISLDERILGIDTMKGAKVNSEFISYNDIDLFVTGEVHKYIDHDLSLEHDLEEEEEEFRFHHYENENISSPIKLLVNTIVHIVKVGFEVKGTSAWEHICLGSDFDGLVNPIDNCQGIDSYKKLREELARAIRAGLAELNQPLIRIKGIEFNEYGLTELIMFGNAKNFLNKYYN